MRPTLLPNMLQTLRTNLRAMPDEPVQIFELGKIYVTRTQAEVEERLAEMEKELEKYPRLLAWEHVENEERLPLEPRRLVGMISGPRYPRSLFSPDSQASEAQLDFFDAKGIVEEMLRHLHIQAEWLPVDAPLFHPGRAAMLQAQGVDLGVVGELHPSLLEEWDIPAQRVGAWDLDVEAILKVMPERAIYRAVSPYQSVRQDMAFVAANTVQASTLARAIKKAGGASIAGVSLFDVYAGRSIPEGHRSLAFAVTFSSPDKALTEEEVARLRKRIESMLERELGAKLRT